MPGALLQFAAFGTQSMYLMGNPQFSYFKSVYKRCSNFAMESMRQTFDTAPVIEQSTRGSFRCKIGKNGDLVKDIFFSFALPNIYADDDTRFQWIENVGQLIVYEYSISVDNQKIDSGYGEWACIWNELTIPLSKRTTFDRMTGNVDDLKNPKANVNLYVIDNNELTNVYYPAGKAGTPSIRSRRIYFPLPFWFTKSPGLALPLIALQYQNLYVTVELRAADELYQLFDNTLSRYVSPTSYNRTFPSRDVSMSRFMTEPESAVKVVDTVFLDAWLEVNYIFLDNDERKHIASQAQTDYLIETLQRIDSTSLVEKNTIDLVLNNPVKELVWITRRSDVYLYNDWCNYSNAYPRDDAYSIMKTATIMFNGYARVEEKEAAYYNLLQPFMHHTCSPREGIYCYSFALHPEKPVQPSGSVNLSMINSTQLYLTANPFNVGESVIAHDKRYYEVTVYAVGYNIFRIVAGTGNLAFTT